MCTLFGLILLCGLSVAANAEDGYRLWLRYDRIGDAALRTGYAQVLSHVVLATPAGVDSPAITAAREELLRGLGGLLGIKPDIAIEISAPNTACGEQGFKLHLAARGNVPTIVISGNRDIGVLYGAWRTSWFRKPMDFARITSDEETASTVTTPEPLNR